jgi:hypothetical protein
MNFKVVLQVIALIFTIAQIQRNESIRGISLKGVGLQALSYGLRFFCTTNLRGYIPVDETGDGM